jgi:hypothetical protein
MECVFYSLVTFVTGMVIGGVFVHWTPLRTDPAEGGARGCGETFALCTCGLDCSGVHACREQMKRLGE